MIKGVYISIILSLLAANLCAQTKSSSNNNIISEETDEKLIMTKKLFELNNLIAVEENSEKKAGLYFQAGIINYVLENYQEAVNYFSEPLKTSTYSKVYMNRALAYSQIDEYDKALDDFNTHLTLLDNYDDFKEMRIIYLTKAKCFSLKGDFENAAKELGNYLDLDNNDVEVLLQRGLTYGALEKVKEAIFDFTKVINMKANVSKIQLASAYEARGDAKNQLKDIFGAMEDLNMAIYLAPNLKSSYLVRGNIYYNKKNYPLALKDYNKVLSIDNDDIDALINRAKIRIKLQDKKGGCLDLSRAGELGSDEAYELIEEYCN